MKRPPEAHYEPYEQDIDVDYGDRVDDFGFESIFSQFIAVEIVRFTSESIVGEIETPHSQMQLPDQIRVNAIHLHNKTTGRHMYLHLHDMYPYTLFNVEKLPKRDINLSWPEDPITLIETLKEALVSPRSRHIFVDFDDYSREHNGDPNYREERNLHPRKVE